MTHDSTEDNLEEWNRRARRPGLHAVFTTRWSEQECESVNAEQQRVALELLGDVEQRRVLDLGCGIGRLSSVLGTRAASVVGVDLSREMLERARVEVGLPHVQFVEASAEALPFSSGDFDCAIASFVLQHLLDDAVFEAAIAELRRVLKPGGRLVTVDGISKDTYRPADSPVTIVRSWDSYSSVLRRHFALDQRTSLRCVEDDYNAMSWTRLTTLAEGAP